MSELGTPGSDLPAPPLSAGAMMRAAREAAGLHIGALAVTLRVPVKKLEALEADRFDLLPDMVLARALAASVCRNLAIDALPILARLPQTAAPQLRTDEAGINVSFRSNAAGSGSLFWDQFSKPYVLLGCAVLMGVLLWAFFVYSNRTPVAAVAKTEAAAVMPGPVALIAPASLPAAPAAEQAPAGLPAPLASGPEGAAPVTVAGSGATTGALVFKAHGASWVEVVDGSGVVQLRRMLTGGETVGVSGVMPLAVVIGHADVTEVQVHGKPFDLAPMTKDKVARFEVKQ